MRKFNYELENELALIEKEAGKAKAMINDIQDRYHSNNLCSIKISLIIIKSC